MKDQLQSLTSLSGPFPPFDLDATCDDPCDLFSIWLREAIESGVREPRSMILSTVDESGAPDARVLILKNLDHRGWHFATTDAGPKGRQIAANPYVALTFYWQQLGRQVRIRGIALPAPEAERNSDFRRRSTAARAVALVGRQSEVLSSRRELDLAVEAQARRIAETPDIVAPNWSVFMVMSHEVEFWQGNPDRLHQRLRYRKAKSGWLKEPLWP
ncbi:pyridoxamine 5'-phosphate oxidase (plasmid) [Rhizobium grahamii]|uniref:Pyridoxamine 5'-phosphate oxidase n=1 Tax=Rhizobium grahamii TaxID=1120045 RepID=A0A5Q0CB50_9HYPH|nr:MULTISPECIES: pyridoxal 5'-phosphate synthase [Rhizobium]QFY63138.1 pyridoxamine 5'-phosphate oxidase [Rhizobium grahamii]QRM52100.1 pyridoxamine 5'-phosphate oxidase [Rhizobium sp. BG6]